MVGHAEARLKELGLAYRVVKLTAGDTGIFVQLTYDLEVWIASQNAFAIIFTASGACTPHRSKPPRLRSGAESPTA